MPTVRDHLKELRNRFLFTIILGVVMFFVVLSLSNSLISFALNFFNISASVLSPLEFINTQINISASLTLLLIVPAFIYQIYRYVEEVLPRKFKLGVTGLVFVSVCLLLLGITFAVWVFLPFSFSFFGNVPAMITQVWGLESIIRYITFCIVIFGLIFQIPLWIYFVDRVGIISRETLAKYRLLVFLSVYIIAGIVTPGVDLYSQSVMAIPMYLLYEVGLLFTRLNFRRSE
jgi:sec-independent protein translocase protein TatC